MEVFFLGKVFPKSRTVEGWMDVEPFYGYLEPCVFGVFLQKMTTGMNSGGHRNDLFFSQKPSI